MSAQISDTFLFKGNEYDLIGINGIGLASPEQFGMKPEMMHTGCYRGFYATYELMEEGLYLREFIIREKNKNYLPIEGIEPEKEKGNIASYHGLNISVSFTGRIRIAKDFIEKYFFNMGYQKPIAFKTVLDMTLKDGHIAEVIDRSEEIEKKRGTFKRRKSVTFLPEIDKEAFIKKAFSLDMDLK